MRVAIFGSCVSRDAFDFVTTDNLVVAEYYARSSFASAFSASKIDDGFSSSIRSTFQRRQVRQDLMKTFMTALPEMNFDVLLVDFTDERFPLYELVDGRVVTVSAELRGTAFPRGLRGEFVQPFSVRHFSLWERGWRNFVQLLSQHDQLHKVRVNCARWSKRTQRGEGFQDPYTNEYIDAANNYFEKLYRKAEADIKTSAFYRYGNLQFEGNDEHKWGMAPFHYTDAYYHALLEQLITDNSHASVRRQLDS